MRFCLIALVLSCAYAITVHSSNFVIAPEVQKALETNNNVVALESTIISHGMPYPENVETAKAVEKILRDNGATPATIAIINGVIHIGLTDTEFDVLGQLGARARKVSRRGVAACVAQHATGATTVAATAYLAHLAGIKVFVTGGIGGVHRGVEKSITNIMNAMDISADLPELGRTPICVICAGAKSILDLPRTLEVLETQGVPVIGYDTWEFPAFFTRESGLKTPLSSNSPKELASMIKIADELQFKSGMLVTVPVPKEYSLPRDFIENITVQVFKEVEDNGITGKDVTPYFLKHIVEKTHGKSLKTNIALVKNNAKVGAHIAAEYAKVSAKQSSKQAVVPTTLDAETFIVGGSLCDFSGKPNKKIILETSNPGSIKVSRGGVAMNIAVALSQLHVKPFFLSAVADDENGKFLLNNARTSGVPLDGILTYSPKTHRTAFYNAINDVDGNLVVAVSDTEIFTELTPALVSQYEAQLAASKIIIFDANIGPDTMAQLCALGKKHGVPTLFEPTSIRSGLKVLKTISQLDYITPNRLELEALAYALGDKTARELGDESDTERENQKTYAGWIETLLNAGVKTVVAKFGASGVMVGSYDSSKKLQLISAPCPKNVHIVSVSGAGDSFVSGIVYGIVRGIPMNAAVELATEAAKLTLESEEAISPLITDSYFKKILRLKKEL